MKSLYPILLFLILIISCKPQFDSLKQKSIGDVKSVETTFISHQPDTRDKHNKRVAVANFNADGTLSNATQYMTYPYTQMDKAEFSFWAEPSKDMFLHMMDGLTLGDAENNFMYGNDWPVYYAEMINKDGHPKFPKRQDIYSGFSSSVSFDKNLPIHIKTEPGLDDQEVWHLSGYEEKFDYRDEKLIFYDRRNILNQKFIMTLEAQVEKRQKELNSAKKSYIINRPPNEVPFKRVSYEYDGSNLIAVKEDNREYKFDYQEEVLIKSAYYVNGVLRNHRDYFYMDNGLKEKTIIYNTNNELEYTIMYKYDFY